MVVSGIVEVVVVVNPSASVVEVVIVWAPWVLTVSIILIGPSSKYLTTNQFLDTIDGNLKKKLN